MKDSEGQQKSYKKRLELARLGSLPIWMMEIIFQITSGGGGIDVDVFVTPTIVGDRPFDEKINYNIGGFTEFLFSYLGKIAILPH